MSRQRVMRMAVAVCLLSTPLWATDAAEDLAQSAADSWLKLVDAEKYADSWTQASKLFQGAVTKQKWRKAASGAREPFGKLLSRKVKSRQATDHLPGAPDGKYVVIQYESVFEAKASATETVTPMLDPDGAWRVSGYFIQ